MSEKKVIKACAPKAGEKQQEFVSRCIADLTNKGEGKDKDQRAAICYSSWRDSKKSEVIQKTIPKIRKSLQSLINLVKGSNG